MTSKTWDTGARRRTTVAIITLAAVLCAGLIVGVSVRSSQSQAQATAVNAERSAAASTPTTTERTREVVIIGDSYTSGSAVGGRGDRSWPRIVESLVKRRVPNTTFKVAGVGGSGYVAQGQANVTFADQVRRTVSRNTDVVVIFGSRNDLSASVDKLRESVIDTYTTVRALSPDARLVVIGPPWINEFPPGALLTQREVIAAVAATFDTKVLDPLGGSWFTTNTPDLIGSDNVHPNDAGHRLMAEKIYPVVLTAVDPTAGMRG